MIISREIEDQPIALSHREGRKYKQLHNFVTTIKHGKDNPELAEALNSEKYSVDFKRKIALSMPDVPSAREWGCRNFTGRELAQFVLLLTSSPMLKGKTSEKDIDDLLSNPAFVSSLGAGNRSDAFTQLLVSSVVNPNFLASVTDYLTGQMIQKEIMTLPVAEAIVFMNDKYSHKGEPSIFPIKLVFAWARQVYDLSDEMPDSWVAKFLEPLESKKTIW